MKNFKFLLFPTYVPVTLIKSKLQIHHVNPKNLDILEFITKLLSIKCLQKFKIFPSFCRSLKHKRSHPKMLGIMEFIR